MPTGRTNPDAGIGAYEQTIIADRHWPHHLKTAGVVVEAPERTSVSRGHDLTCHRVGEVWETDGDNLIKVGWPISLNCDHKREFQAFWQFARQAIRRHRCDAHHAAPRSII